MRSVEEESGTVIKIGPRLAIPSGAAALWLALLSLAVVPALAAGDTVEQKASTTSYNVVLDIGPTEMMLTPDQAKARNATSGEVMAAMPSMGMAMTMAQGNRHVELHVSQKTGGAVVKDANVAITLTNVATNASTSVQPIMAMYGVAAGEADWHYGNNAQVPAGTYRVAATVNGEAATFAPATLGGPSAPAASGSLPMPATAPATGAGAGSVSDPPTPVAVLIVVSLGVVVGVALNSTVRLLLSRRETSPVDTDLMPSGD